MQRLERITAILIQLQSKRIVTASELAERFEVSKRTIYRDIKTLEKAGIPIGVKEGIGYFIIKGYHLPPVMFSEEEANAMITVEKIIKYHSEESLIENYTSALIKVKSVLKYHQKDKIDFLDQRIVYSPPWAPKSNYLSSIQLAITNNIAVDIHYESGSKSEFTKRQVSPYGIYFNGVTWTFIGYCHLRKAIREFRLDRIIEFKQSTLPFKFDSSFNLEVYFDERSKKKF